MANIIIDGYNLIRRSTVLSAIEAASFERGRLELIRKLALYRQAKNHSITVVFDAGASDNISIERDRLSGINILYSEMGQTADEVIISLARKLKNQAIVVSSDNEIRHAAKSAGCGILGSDEFEDMLNNQDIFRHERDEPSRPLHKRWMTKKKGASHKLPKAKRRAYAKLRGV